MKLSIIVPAYNVAKYLETCIYSCEDQNVPQDSYEIIIINDGSTDETLDIAYKLKLKYSNIQVISQKNAGLSNTRNKGIDLSRGEYIWFVDSDDWIDKNCLEYLYEILSRENYDLIVTPLQRYSEKLQKNTSIDIHGDSIKLTGKEYLFRNYPYGASQRYIIKKSILVTNNLYFYSGIYHEDMDFGPRMLWGIKSLYILQKPIYYYRLRTSGSIMSSWKRKNSEDTIFIGHRLIAFAKEYIENPKECKKFYFTAFYAAYDSVSFAKGHHHSKEFKEFYKDNKNKLKALALFYLYKSFSFKKRFVKVILFCISPYYCYKIFHSFNNCKMRTSKKSIAFN